MNTKPFFLQLTTTDNDYINLNLNSVIYFKKTEDNKTLIYCTDNVDIFVIDSFEEISEFIEKAIEHSDG